jgi:transcription elongation factor
MLTRGDFVRITGGPREGQTGVVQRVHVSYAEVWLSSTKTFVFVPRNWLRREEARAVTIETTEQASLAAVTDGSAS